MNGLRATGAALDVVTASEMTVGVLAPTASATTAYPELAEQLRVPPGHRRVATLWASGVRIYQRSGNTWTLTEPAAVLTQHGRPVALHSSGPTWTSIRDGSRVIAAAVGHLPRHGAVPELLMKAVSNQGPGMFAQVTYIQRLNTLGGMAPGEQGAPDGARAAVPYSATYTFFAAE